MLRLNGDYDMAHRTAKTLYEDMSKDDREKLKDSLTRSRSALAGGGRTLDI